jgi:hypothetical protein
MPIFQPLLDVAALCVWTNAQEEFHQWNLMLAIIYTPHDAVFTKREWCFVIHNKQSY